jgi:hypothetical protein
MVRAEPRAIAARAIANAINARQSRVTYAIDVRDATNWNLTKLAPLRFMIHWM